MTKSQFDNECTARLIAPAIALENDEVREALAAHDDARVLQLLDQEF